MVDSGPFSELSITKSDARALLESPPDGVDLNALGPGAGQLLPPDACERLYTDAFVAAGGEAARELSWALSAELTRGGSARGQQGGALAHQLRIWQAYDLAFMMERLGQGSTVRLHGERRLEALALELREHVHPSVVLNVAAMKKWGRSSVKVRIKYASDCSQLCDLNRAELVCPSIEVMYSAARHLFDCWGPVANRQDTRLVEWEDHYQAPMPGGYRHLQVLAFIGGSVWELQLNTAPMLEAKHRAGHKLYKTTRFVKEMLLLASMEGDVDTLRDILSRPGVRAVANPNEARDKNGLTAMHHAAFRGDEELLEVLMDADVLATVADPWATDKTEYGGLPLNYALQMRNHRLAQVLAERMATQAPPEPLSRMATARLAEAVAVAVDVHEEALGSGHCRSSGDSSASSCPWGEFSEKLIQTTEKLLRTLVWLWQAVEIDATWKGMHPLAYAFHTKAVSSVGVLLACVDLWMVDEEGWLPIERVIRLDFRTLVESAAMRMLATQPLQVPASAAWSLARCRDANLPEDLLGELRVNDRRLQRRIYTCGSPQQLDSSCSEAMSLRQSDALDLKTLKEAPLDTRYRCMVMEDDVLYAGTSDGSIHKWDARTLELAGKWQGHLQRVSCLLLGSKRPGFDGVMRARKLFSGSFDNTVRIWDLWKGGVKGHCIGVLKHTEDVRALARYGSVLFAAQGPRIALWDIAKVGSMRRCGELRGHPGLVDALAFFGSTLFSAGQCSELRVWGKAGGGREQWYALQSWRGHSDQFRVRCIAGDADGRFFSAAHADSAGQHRGPGAWVSTRKDAEAEVCFWSGDGNLTAKQSVPSPITGMHCMEGVLFTSDLGGHIRLWSAACGQAFSTFSAHGGEIRAFLVGGGGGGLAEVEDSDEDESRELPARQWSAEAQGRAGSSHGGKGMKAELGRTRQRTPSRHGQQETAGTAERGDSAESGGARPESGSNAQPITRLPPPRLPFFRSGTDRTQLRSRAGSVGSSRSRGTSSRPSNSASPSSRSPVASNASTDISPATTPVCREKCSAADYRPLRPPRQQLDASFHPL